MRAHYQKFRTDVFALACVILFALQVSAAANEALPQLVEYQLDVSFNGQPAGRIARFADLGDGRFASPASELRELGLKVPAAVPDDELVPLDGFASVSYVYDEAKQTIAIEISDDLREPVAFNARGEQGIVRTKPSDYGALLNYSVFGAVAGEDVVRGIPSSGFSGVNALIDGRILTPHGVFNQTAIVGTTRPRLTLVLDIDPELGLARARERGSGEDRYEKKGLAFHQKIRGGFLAIAEADPARCKIIDASASVDDVAAAIWLQVALWL